MHMGGSCIGTWGQVPPPPDFLESNVKSLIFTIGAPYFYATSRLCAACVCIILKIVIV